MNLKKIVSRYRSLFFFAILFEARTIWEYFLSPNIHTFLVGSSIALVFLVLPFPLEMLSAWLEKLVERKKIVGSAFVFLLVVFCVVGFWKDHSRMWAVLNAILGLFFLLVIWKDRIFPNSEARKQERRVRTENLFADRDAFEKSWQRRIKITEGIILLFCALLAVVCWMTSFKILAIVPALLGALFLIGLFASLTPMSDEKFEKHLAKAKARHERTEARRAEFAARRAERAERLAERKKQQTPGSVAAESFSSFVYWSVMACVFWFPNRSTWERPDLVFCAMPAWYLIRAIYFFIRQQDRPKGPDAPLMPGSSTASR
jgi:hypothetical protein